jgi:ferredoxin
MRAIKIVIPSAIVLGGLLLSTFSLFGTPEYGKKEKKACTACHVKVVSDKAEMAKNLNATGTCYKGNEHSLAKCAAPKK